MNTRNTAPADRRVCVFTSVHPTFDIRIFHKQCKSLRRAGYDVTLIACHDQDITVDGIIIKAIPTPKNRLGRMTFTTWRIFFKALQQRAAVYHFHDSELLPVGLLLRAAGKKVIYDVHEDLIGDLGSRPSIPQSLRRWLAAIVDKFERFSAPRLSAIICATPAIAERYLSMNLQTTVVQNFVLPEELPQAQIAWDDRKAAVSYIGVISAARGIQEMVRAIALLPEGLQGTLELAGRFSPLTLERDVTQMEGWRRVQFRGQINERSRVVEFLAGVRVGLVCSHASANDLRSWPTKLLEYMCAGIPVIASDFPTWRAIIEGAHCGMLVDPMNVDEIAAAIHYLLTHDAEAEAMGKRGREAVQSHYGWKSEERKLLSLYGTLIGFPLPL